VGRKSTGARVVLIVVLALGVLLVAWPGGDDEPDAETGPRAEHAVEEPRDEDDDESWSPDQAIRWGMMGGGVLLVAIVGLLGADALRRTDAGQQRR